MLAVALQLGCSATALPSPSPASAPATSSSSPTTSSQIAGHVDLAAPDEQATLLRDVASDVPTPRLMVIARMIASTGAPGGASAALRPGTSMAVRIDQTTLRSDATVSCRTADDRAVDVLNVPDSAFVRLWCSWYTRDTAITAAADRVSEVEVDVTVGGTKVPVRVTRTPLRSRTHVDPQGRFLVTYPDYWSLVSATADHISLAWSQPECELSLARSNQTTLSSLGQPTEIEIGMRRFRGTLTSTSQRSWVIESLVDVYDARWMVRAACRRTGDGPDDVLAKILPLWRRP